MTSAVIFGCSGPTLTAEEAAFFAQAQPWGFILFRRNVETPDQLRALTAALRATVGRPDAPVLIDQEGGRVQRLGPPHWRRYPPGRAYGQLGVNRREITRLGARLIAHDLAAVGINVNCLPLLDVPDPDAHDVIGDRAYADTPGEVALLGRTAAEGLIAGGVLPVIKHIPGHGRARADSHLALPVVDASLAELDSTDFAPFKALSDMPIAMTAHVVYSAIDPQPATISHAITTRIIRQSIGFNGLLVTDDISMHALSGPLEHLSRTALDAGCDVILHCNGDMAQMKSVLTGAQPLQGHALRRAQAALARIPKAVEPFDATTARARFDAAFQGRWAA